ncbi:MAG: thiol-activated cytolysin family protein [Bacilli bacterium]|nr:thiol-activated cytolysin family protein [Bacilli bacterium]
MKFRKIMVLAASALMLVGVAGCNNNLSQTVNNNVQEVDVVEETPSTKNLKISNNTEVADFVRNQDFDPNKVLAFDLRPTVELDKTCTGVEEGNRLIVTKKESRNAVSGTGSLHCLEQSEMLFPGQILLADSGLVDGNPTPMTNLDRGNTTLEVVLPGLYDSEFEVAKTKRSNIRNGIQQKVDEWVSSPKKKKLTNKTSLKITQVYDQRQAGLDIGFEIAKKLSIKSDYKQDVEKNIFVVSFEQIFYTVNTSLDNDTLVFADTVTKADVEREIGSTPAVIISQASYGKMVFLKIETTKDKSQIDAAFKYAGSINVDAKAQFQNTLANCSITSLVYGGAVEGGDPESPVPTEIKDTTDSSKADVINSLFSTSLSSDSSEVQNAVMLSYQTSWLKNNKKATVQATAEYVETTRTIIDEQELEIKNIGGFVVLDWWVSGEPVTINPKTGALEYGARVTIEHASRIHATESRKYRISAKYARLHFVYKILLGTKQAFNQRIYSKDFFNKAYLETAGTTLINHVNLTVDGSYRSI